MYFFLEQHPHYCEGRWRKWNSSELLLIDSWFTDSLSSWSTSDNFWVQRKQVWIWADHNSLLKELITASTGDDFPTRGFSPAGSFVQSQKLGRTSPGMKWVQQKMIKFCPNRCPAHLPPVLDSVWVGGGWFRASVTPPALFLHRNSCWDVQWSQCPQPQNFVTPANFPRKFCCQKRSGSFPSKPKGWDLICASLLGSRDGERARENPNPSHRSSLGVDRKSVV